MADRENKTSSDLSGLAAYHASGSDATTHRPPLAGCGCPLLADGWIPIAEGLPEINTAALAGAPSWYAVKSQNVNIIVDDKEKGGRVSSGQLCQDERGQWWWDAITRYAVGVTHWQPLPPLPGDVAEPPTMEYCLAMAAYWQRLAAEIGGATLATSAEIETAEYWRGRAAEAERTIRVMKDLDSKEIV